jgi:hypothetical protein
MSEAMKTCGTYQKSLSLDNFHKNATKSHGLSGRCKACSSVYRKKYEAVYKLDPAWVEKKRTTGREWARRNPDQFYFPEQQKQAIDRYNKRYPEKNVARRACQYLPKVKGFRNHHWSYNEEHWKDVIVLSTTQHTLAHRFMTYDQERMMYRRMDGSLIDSREAAIAYYATLVDDTPSKPVETTYSKGADQ